MNDFARASDGECAFCMKEPDEVDALLGAAGREMRICSACLGLCRDIVANRTTTAAARAGEAGGKMQAITDAVRAIEQRYPPNSVVVRDRPQFFAMHEEIREEIARLTPATTHRERARQAALAERACSFCDAPQSSARLLIDGPGPAICDACVLAASAT